LSGENAKSENEHKIMIKLIKHAVPEKNDEFTSQIKRLARFQAQKNLSRHYKSIKPDQTVQSFTIKSQLIQPSKKVHNNDVKGNLFHQFYHYRTLRSTATET
jgi:hypothetical protein